MYIIRVHLKRSLEYMIGNQRDDVVEYLRDGFYVSAARRVEGPDGPEFNDRQVP
jgi:hypothetical protein